MPGRWLHTEYVLQFYAAGLSVIIIFLLFLDSVAGNTSTRYGAFLCHFGGTSHDDAKQKTLV